MNVISVLVFFAFLTKSLFSAKSHKLRHSVLQNNFTMTKNINHKNKKTYCMFSGLQTFLRGHVELT